MASAELQNIISAINGILSDVGFELYPFKVRWYNDLVEPKFYLPYPPETVALTIISTPDMFEKAFKPYLCRENYTPSQDPIDNCIAYYMEKVQDLFPDTDVMYASEMIAPRHPKILVQTAAHVSGGAFYYQRKDLTDDPWDEKTKIYGVCIHPKYGGWFSIRAVIIFKDLQDPDLVYKPPIDVVPDNKDRIKLLKELNENWQNWKYRDIIPVTKTYSEDAKAFFALPPGKRGPIIEELRKKCPVK